MMHKPHAEVSSPDEPFVVLRLTHLSLTKADLKPPFDDPDPKGPYWDFIREQIAASKDSLGCVVNSFYKLESPYFDYFVGNFRWIKKQTQRQENICCRNKLFYCINFGYKVHLNL
ncbi:Cytokinin-O-glucosyltransferase 3 [Carex littledalei]|uniref:Cytokinin-O-glucosyltransferase 3 n=1 Tax=Carex littledalei TaxID=544730 RepID=A0A833VJC2_9POAL|nr:Cytokinin-O-glucosyltransferase 3 [Carex littledalei]